MKVNTSLGGITALEPTPAIHLPAKPGFSGYGKKFKPIPAHGGDQYGVTMQKSRPAVDFPSSKPAFSAASAGK